LQKTKSEQGTRERQVSTPHVSSHKLALGHPLEEPLKIYPVSNLVNSPETDDARCIELAAIDWDFFERQWWGGVRGKAEMWKAEMSQF
jgi:hypothetical protein